MSLKKGTITFSQSKTNDSGSYIIGKIEWRQEEDVLRPETITYVYQDIYVKKGNSSTTLNDPTTGTWTYSTTFGTVSSHGSAPSKSVLTDWVWLARKENVIAYESDGTASVRLGGHVQAPSGTSYAGLATSGYETVALAPYNKPTLLNSLSSVNGLLNEEITATYTPRSASFRNQCIVEVNVNGTLTQILTEKLGQKATTAYQEYPIQFKSNQLSKIYGIVKNTANVTIGVTFRTYRDTNYTIQVGTDQYREITLSIPPTVAPEVDLQVSPINSNDWLASEEIYVAGLSGVTATMTGEAGEGAQVKARNIIYDGSTYDATTPLNIPTLKKSGTVIFTAQLIDSRNRSASESQSITVLSYSAPAVTSMTTERGTYNGGKWEVADNGEDIKVTFNTTLSLKDNGNLYNAVFKLDGSAKSPVDGDPTNLASVTEYAVYFTGVSGEVSHTLAMTVTDKAGKTGTATLTVPTKHITIEFNDSGKGIAFGKTSEKDAFECAWDADFHGTVKKIRDDGAEVLLDDTGWIELGLSTNVSKRANDVGHAGSGCKYRVINGNHVYVAFACDVPYSNATIVVNADMIPESHRPKQHIYGLSASGGRTITALYVHYNGQICINYIQQITATSNTTSLTTWVDGYIDYWI